MPPKARALLRALALLSLVALAVSLHQRRAAREERLRLTGAPRLSGRGVSGGVGVSLGLFASDPAWGYEGLLKELKGVGAARVMLVVPLRQGSHTSSAPWLAVPVGVIERTARQARALGLHLSLMPIIHLEAREGGRWRGALAPEDPERWWASYTTDLRRLATLAEREGFERLVVGSELCSLEGDLPRWARLIAVAREHFKGVITYSANWDHYAPIGFWPLLDEVSVTAYFPLKGVEGLEAEWERHLSDLEGFAATQGEGGRPLMITEYGYPPLESALRAPWDEWSGAPFNPHLQAELVARSTALLVARSGRGRVRGAFLWNWFGFGGAQDRGFTVRGRVGEGRLRGVLGGE